MPVDPKECRKHALFCTELAAAARTARWKVLFLELSESWERLAIQLEDAKLTEKEDIRSYIRELRAHVATPPPATGATTFRRSAYVTSENRDDRWR
jgi:hypothetical protein